MDFSVSTGLTLFALTALATAISWIMIPVIIRLSIRKRLFDTPDGLRKIHTSITPTLGGVAIFAAILFSFSVSGFASDVEEYPWLVGALMILFFTGIKDDLLVIDPEKKFLGQMLATLLVIWSGDLLIDNLGGVFGLYQIPAAAAIPLTLFTLIVIINAYNLVDGIDGLAGGIGVIAASLFGFWFLSVGQMALAMLAFVTVGALIGFLLFNFEPASIFMGDTGSQIVGFLLGFLTLNFLQIGMAEGTVVPFKNAIPLIPVAILIVPLYDTLRVFLIRTLSRKAFFRPDRQHIHHQFIDLGYSHRRISLIIFLQNLVIIGVTLLVADLNVNMILGVILASSLLIFPTFNLKRNILKTIGFNLSGTTGLYFHNLAGSIGIEVEQSNGNGYHPFEEEEEEREVEEMSA